MGFFDFFTGTPEKHEQVSTLTPQQQRLQKNQLKARMGALGEAADYYRGNLSDNPQDFAAFAAPEMRQFNEQIIPGLSEQFAGMGAGGLSSSGFRNAAVGAGTDLSERLGALRAQLRQQSANALAGIGSGGLEQTTQDVMTQPGSEGFLSSVMPAIGTAAGSFAAPFGAAAGKMANDWLSSSMKGKSGPYQSGYKGSFGQLPGFGG
jgi:hypothetical protein